MNLFKTGFINAAAVLARAVTSIILNKLSALALGPQGFVVFGNFQTLISLLQGIGNGVIYTGSTKLLAEREIDSQFSAVIVKTAIYMSLIGGGGGLLLLLIAKRLIIDVSCLGGADCSNATSILILFLPAIFLVATFTGYFNGSGHIAHLVAGNVIASMLALSIGVFFIQHYGAEGTFLAVLGTAVVPIIVYPVFLLKTKGLIRDIYAVKPSFHIAKRILPYLYSALGSAIIPALSLIFIRSTLTSELGETAAGTWQALWRFSELYIAPLTSTLSVYFLPRFSSLATKSQVRSEFGKSLLILLGIMMIISSTIIYLDEWLISVVFSSAFNGVVALLPLQLIGDFLKIAGWLMGFLMLAKGRSGIYLVAELVFAAFFCGVTVYLIPSSGIQAAPIAYIAAYSAYFSFSYISMRMLRHI